MLCFVDKPLSCSVIPPYLILSFISLPYSRFKIYVTLFIGIMCEDIKNYTCKVLWNSDA
jgi:hypothetical protein